MVSSTCETIANPLGKSPVVPGAGSPKLSSIIKILQGQWRHGCFASLTSNRLVESQPPLVNPENIPWLALFIQCIFAWKQYYHNKQT